ncbi:MAG: hypothetical protein M3327_03105 [Actinomycetota bacterium]|nr:hypothetical protein [Actinomycetota bacterium]
MTRRWIRRATLPRERVTHHRLQVVALRLERILALVALDITRPATLDELRPLVEA